MNIYDITPYIRYSVYRVCPRTGWKIETRTIPDHEFVLITGGRGTVILEGKRFEALPGRLFYFHPGLPHSLESSTAAPLCFHAFHFSYSHVSFLNGNWTVTTGDSVLPLKTMMETGGHVRLKELMKEINRHWTGKRTGYQMICNGLFLQFLYHLLEDAEQNREDYAARLKVEKVIGYIRDNYQTRLPLQDLALYAGLSPDYLTSIFRSHTGLSPVKYINKYRIDAAKELLSAGKAKVKDIAILTGFKDEFYFSRTFKKLEGISPTEFSRNYTESEDTSF